MMVEEYKNFVTILRSCARSRLVSQALQIHTVLVKMGSEVDIVLSNTLLNVYAKLGRIEAARQVFVAMPERNVVSWTILMDGYLQQTRARESLSLLRDMGIAGVKPNEFTYSINLKACGLLVIPAHGLQIHVQCVKNGFEGYAVVGNALIDMYANSGQLCYALQVFEKMPLRNQISWNTMIAAHIHGGDARNSLVTFKNMQEQGEVPDEFTLASILKACSSLGLHRTGKIAHATIITLGCSESTILSSALVDLYVKCKILFDARKVFESISAKNIVSWTTMIIGYAQDAKLVEAMEFFSQLRRSEIQIDSFVISSLVGAFADFALLEQGTQIHAYAIKVPFGLDVSVGNSIMDMYIKCGMIPEAEQVFTEMPERNTISFTVMINGYGKHGCGNKAINLFNEMEAQGIEPDEVTFLAILSACSHAGLLEEGREYFTKYRKQVHFEDKQEHYACMVDLLGRAGRLDEAKSLIDSMKVEPSCGLWQTLLGACRVHGNVDLGRKVGEILLRLDGDNPVNYVALSNLYADAGQWDECEVVRKEMKKKGLKKEVGWSWIEIDKKIYFFYGGDDKHPLIKEILKALIDITRKVKEMGYVVGVRFSLHDVDEESKEENLRLHSEKLAIGLGIALGFGREGRTIRVFKNLRVCGDCHEFLKGASKALEREILVRDANRFHKFHDGICSCGDYW